MSGERELRTAAEELSRCWDEWMQNEEDEGFDAVVEAVAALRAALDTGAVS